MHWKPSGRGCMPASILLSDTALCLACTWSQSLNQVNVENGDPQSKSLIWKFYKQASFNLSGQAHGLFVILQMVCSLTEKDPKIQIEKISATLK